MTDPAPENRKMISAYKSPTLADIVYYTNQHSDNSLGSFIKNSRIPEIGRPDFRIRKNCSDGALEECRF